MSPAGHTRTPTDDGGPDYCAECSEAEQSWVVWPCSRPSLRDRLEEIMRDMDAAYAAIKAAGYPAYDGPEHEALEAVYVRLRAWNAAVGR